MSCAFIALGSNLKDPQQQLQRAITAILELPHSDIVRVSSAYRSAAVGPGDQPDYLNAVLRLETSLSPLDLLTALQKIENTQGRERNLRWGARTLDLDILLYDDQTIDTSRLSIPHPRMRERNFVVYPLQEIEPSNFMLPDGTELGTLVAACPMGELRKTEISLTPSHATGSDSAYQAGPDEGELGH